ncbi:MAG: CinA family protein [Candidatus Nanopelagicales bacterium]|nr:CinA family protein [Candidatus Nanopelagicales bacterium]
MSSAEHGAARVVKLLHANRKTICTAESFTGGELASALVDIAGASAVFAGGVTTYSLEAKRAVLGFSQIELAGGAVSAEVAINMAQRVRKLFGTDYSLSTTGVAGPGPHRGVAEGTVWLGFASKTSSEAISVDLVGVKGPSTSGSSRNVIRAAAVTAALELVFTQAVFDELHPQT